METITFYSYKGGTGRTLTLANFALYLSLLGQRVVAIDCDLEAPGLHYKFSGGSLPPPQRGLLDYILLDGSSSLKKEDDIQNYLIKVPLSSGVTGKIWLLPAGQAPTPRYGSQLSQLNWRTLLYSEGARGALSFLELKEVIEKDIKPDFLLVDARTGITEIGGIASSILADKLVCLLLPNRESMEGTRTVLRAMSVSPRPPGMAPIKIFPVLSRVTEDEPSLSRKVVSDILHYLNEPAEKLGATLNIGQVDLLRNDASLMESERTLVGSSERQEPSSLLRQYLKLFYNIVPEIVQQQTDPIIGRAVANLLDDPEGAQSELENLAFSSDAPAAYRALLKVYNLRNVPYESAYQAAQRLWEFGDNTDIPLLGSFIEKGFEEVYSFAGDEGIAQLMFVEDVWRKTGCSPKVAVDLAESFDNFSHHEKALALIEEALKYSDEENLVHALIMQLDRLDRIDAIRAAVSKYRQLVLSSPLILMRWARSEAQSDSDIVPSELLAPEVLSEIEEYDSEITVRLLIKAGREREARQIALKNLETAIELGEEDDQGMAARLLESVGGADIARDRLVKKFGEEGANNIFSPRYQTSRTQRPRLKLRRNI